MLWVSQFLPNALKTIGLMDIGTLQPFGWLEFEPLFAKQYVKRIELLMQKTEEQHISIRELALLWPTTGSVRIQLFFLFGILKAAHIEKQKRIKLCNFFFEMLNERAVSDVHGTVSNITKTKEEVYALLTKIQPQKANPEIARLLGKISNAAYNLIAGLYLDIYLDYAMENEGPYNVSKIYGMNHILIIKKYIGLQTDVWQQVKVPLKDLLVYCIYKDVKFSCDMAPCHSVYYGDVINNLVAFAVEKDGKMVSDKEEIEGILKPMEDICVQQWLLLKSLSIEEFKKKGLLIKFYGMRRLFERVGISWQPTKAMEEAVKGKPLIDNNYWRIPKENQKEYWAKIYNPIIDFYPQNSLNLFTF